MPSTTSKPLALYARVSTTDQRLESQLEGLHRYARDRGAEALEFVDHGVSGAVSQRPALDGMLEGVRRRRFGVVVVTKLDRLARSVRHLTSLAGELEALGVDLVVLDQAIDTATPTGRLLFNVLGSIAEFERDLIRERVMAGQEAARRRGTKLGRPEATDRGQRERIRRLRESGHSMRAIGELLGLPKTTVARVVGRRRSGAA